MAAKKVAASDSGGTMSGLEPQIMALMKIENRREGGNFANWFDSHPTLVALDKHCQQQQVDNLSMVVADESCVAKLLICE